MQPGHTFIDQKHPWSDTYLYICINTNLNIYGAELKTETHDCLTNGAPTFTYAPVYKIRKLQVVWINNIRGSIVVSISACHAEDPGSIPSGGVFLPQAKHDGTL